MQSPIRALLLAAAFIASAVAAEARCLKYEPVPVTLEGVLTTRSVPGPPGYVSVARGDYPETIVIVELDEPICLLGDTSSRYNSKAYANVTAVQLVLSDQLYLHLVNERVRATGTLFAARTPHHRTPVVLTLKTLRGL